MPSGGKPPAAPDPLKVGAAQAGYSKDLFDYQNTQNRVNYTSPTGTATWGRTEVFDEEGYNKAMKDWEGKYTPGSITDPTAAYLAENPDVAASLANGGFGGDARAHYFEYGKDEGRTNFWELDESGRPMGTAPSKDKFTTTEWNAESKLSPEEQAIFDSGQGVRTGIATSLNNNAASIFANAGPTDYSGVHGLETVDKRSAPGMASYINGDAIDYDVRESALLGADKLVDYQKMSNNGQYDIGRYGGGPAIGDWGGGQLDLSAFDKQIRNWGAEAGNTGGYFAGMAGDQANRWNNTDSSMRDWASILGPQMQAYQQQMTSMNPWEYDEQGADAMYRSQMRYAEPQWAQDKSMIEARLGEQGFVPGTPAYNNALKQMLDSQAMERDQARDKATLAGREFGNQAFDNRSGNLQNAIANLLGFGEMGINTDKGRDEGNAAFGALGRDWANTGIDAGRLQRDAGQLGLDSEKLGLDYLTGKTDAFGANIDSQRLGLDSDIAQGNQSRSDFETMAKGIKDQFGIDLDITKVNNEADAQRISDLIEGAKANTSADIATNQANNDYASTYADVVDTNAGIMEQNNEANSDFFNDNVTAVKTNNDARTQGLDEADQIQQGDLNWLLDMLKQLDIQLPPELLQTNGGSLQGADLASLFGDEFAAKMSGYNADVSSDNATTGAISSMIAAYLAYAGAAVSDRRLKADISETAFTSPKGYRVYRYRYLWDQPATQRLGVMAQDILAAGGEGVIPMPNGFYAVDYSKV